MQLLIPLLPISTVASLWTLDVFPYESGGIKYDMIAYEGASDAERIL